MGRLEECLMDFSINSLKTYLGDELVDTLIEWTPENEPLFTKKKLTDMIMTIHGNEIFKNRDFRRDLLEKMTDKELEGLKQITNQRTDDLSLLIENVVKIPWKDNAVSAYITKILNLKVNFNKENLEQNVINQVESTDRFFELLDYQYYVKQRILNILNDDSEQLKRVLIQMPTGTGKTKTAMHIIVNYILFSLKKEGLVIWVAHTTELLEQAYSTFVNVWKHLGDGEITAYKIWGNSDLLSIDSSLNGIAFCGISKLTAMSKSNPNLFEKLEENCRLIFFDEAHKAAAAETRKIIEKLMEYKQYDKSLVGLTATPGRTTEDTFDNNLLSNMFENRLIGIDLKTVYQMNMSKLQMQNADIENSIVQYFQNMHVLAKIRKEELCYQESFTDAEINSIQSVAKSNGYIDFSKKTLETIGRNKSRNMAIMNRLTELYDEGKNVIVFTCSVEQAKLLSAMLELQEIETALIIGDMPAIEREKAIEKFKNRNSTLKIIINYEVLTTGFDATNINCVFIARPTQSVVLYSQMLGRGLRGSKMGGNDECLLIDVKDNLNKYNEKMAFSHFENYWKA